MFRLAGLGDDIDGLIEYLDDHGDEVRSKADIPAIKVQNHVNPFIYSSISGRYLFLFSILLILVN